jgi:uncharacterized repeat protein (TIGR04076 family)
MSHEDFRNTKVKITCEEKLGTCIYNVGDTFVYSKPIGYIEELCSGIQDPARPYITRCAAGIPSWEGDDKSIYRIHCISKKGTVWRIEKLT